MWGGSRRISKTHWSAVIQSLDLLSNHSLLKFDELMITQGGIHNYDSGMLAVYDLILAMKARVFASCVRDGKHGCSNNQAVEICKKCNHIGKFGKLAISLRERFCTTLYMQKDRYCPVLSSTYYCTIALHCIAHKK